MLLNNIQKALYQIKSLIINNEEIQKLLYYTSADCLELNALTSDAVEDRVVLFPVFNTTKEPFNSSSFITIQIVTLSDDEESSMKGILRINIMSHNNLWEINNSKIRPLKIIDVLISILDGTKFSISNKLHFSNMQLAVLGEDVSGYIIIFDILEGSGLESGF